MGFRWSLHFFGEAKALALLCVVCLEYHQRVAQENVTFALIGRAKCSHRKRSGAGCATTRVGRLPSAANVHETAKGIEPERCTQRHRQHSDQPSSKAIFRQIPDPAPESGGFMAGPVLVPVSLPASDLTQELFFFGGNDVFLRSRCGFAGGRVVGFFVGRRRLPLRRLVAPSPDAP